jgi:hypothetical protein
MVKFVQKEASACDPLETIQLIIEWVTFLAVSGEKLVALSTDAPVVKIV